MNEAIFGMFLGLVTLLIPIILILTHHQRKMAELIHKRADADRVLLETEALRREVAELRDRLNHQMLEADNRQRLIREMPEPPIRPTV